jgi:hypothetical protein
VDGTRYTQPLTLRLDPRVKTSAAALGPLAALSKEMWAGAIAANDAQGQARAWLSALDGMQGTAVANVRTQLEALAPPRGPRTRFRRAAAGAAPTLSGASTAMMAAAMAMQGADVAPTASQVAACASARTMGTAAMAAWTRLRTTGLAAINAERRSQGQPALTVPSASAP